MPSPSIAVCIATTGRPTILTETLRDIARQTRAPDRVLVCPVTAKDLDWTALPTLGLDVEVVTSRSGLPAQRNSLLRAAGDADIVLFVDDDFLLAPSYIEGLLRLFAARSTCVIATGHVLADGATGPGLSAEVGRAIVDAHVPAASPKIEPAYNAYGCNMAVRWSALVGTGCWFDETLPLYAWAEDVDFSRQAAAFGEVLKSDAIVGVHLATKTGRVSGVRFGYSQIANQVYLTRKGTVSSLGALKKAMENMAANAAGAIRNTGMIDRRGRLVGNLYGILDVLTGRSDPRRILDL